MIFDDWEEHPGHKIRPHLLWEYNLDTFDWHKSRAIVVERVVERGRPEDWYAAIHLYGGLDNFIDIVKNEVVRMHPKNLSYVCVGFDLKKEDLKCFHHSKRREELILKSIEEE